MSLDDMIKHIREDVDDDSDLCNCGAPVEDDSRRGYCDNCGKPLVKMDEKLQAPKVGDTVMSPNENGKIVAATENDATVEWLTSKNKGVIPVAELVWNEEAKAWDVKSGDQHEG